MVAINNRPPVVSGPITVTLSEDAGLVYISPTINTVDPDLTDLLRPVNIPADLPAGIFWDPVFNTFYVDTTHPAFQSLSAGEVSVLTVNFAITDLTDTVPHSLVLTVTGTNDGAVVTGVASGAVTEDGNGVVTGVLAVTDIDNGQAAFVAATQAGAYGSLTIDAAGAWTYVLDNANPDVNALGTGQSLVDTITVVTLDGTERVISLTVNGADERMITGTSRGEVLMGTNLDEMIFGLGGSDRLLGNGGADYLDGGSGGDRLYGGDGDDSLVFDSRDLVQSGGAGIDTLVVARAIRVNLGSADQVQGDSGVTKGIENVDAQDATQSVILVGSSGSNILAGGAAADQLTGGLGADVLIGNAGADRFIFRSLAESRDALADEIADFTHGVDRIDVSAIDAIAGTQTNNAFQFIGGADFTRAGQLRYDVETGMVEADVNGDGIADLSIAIGAGLTITAGDFLL